MDGETLIEIIGHERPHIKLLWMSGFQADAVSSRRRNIPFLQKPFSLQELLNAVASALREDTEKAGGATDHGP
jgi:DNA-binding NtrC family response regulator